MRILVVDTDASIRNVVADVLRDHGHDVTKAASGDEALTLFAKQPFPIVISEICMPKINGIQILQTVKQLRSNTQVIIMTGHSSMNSAVDAIRSGAHSYLVKPFGDLDTISTAVNKAVRKLELAALRVLVVDDEPSVRGIVAEILSDEGHLVTEADSAEEARRLFREQAFPLVITDIRMSGMSGLALLGEIKKMAEDTEVVIMTSYASMDTAVGALRAGAFDYLTKPFEDLNLVSSMVNRVIDKIHKKADRSELVVKLKEKNDELELANDGLKAQAQHDGLTGLHNRRYFQETIENEFQRASRHGRPLSLIFLDVDYFKQYNDRHGHPAGDKALRMLARILRGRARESDLVARYGGEEFVLLLPETDAEGARNLADIIRRSVESYPFPGRSTQPKGKVTISVGVATFPHDGTEATVLIDRADRALYEAKRMGRNTIRCAVAG